ncbi:MAG TPA: transposase [Bacteroidales bacterium]|nr:transposase [Bacteroidales bacterium]HPO65478.1 transposase [Bacteroidales bacterium]
MDEEIEKWHNRELKERYLYLLLDARYDKCRVDHKIMDVAVMLAIEINEEGHLRVVGLDVKFDETSMYSSIHNEYENIYQFRTCLCVESSSHASSIRLL